MSYSYDHRTRNVGEYILVPVSFEGGQVLKLILAFAIGQLMMIGRESLQAGTSVGMGIAAHGRPAHII
jgi:hypothetical protein